MKTYLQAYDLGCEPSPSVPAEILIQDGQGTYLLFYACSKSTDARGRLQDLGVAVVECRRCSCSKFGYPNDEGLPEHPLYKLGLEKLGTAVVEVLDSAWCQEVAQQQRASAQRIWQGRNLPVPSASIDSLRHFLVLLKETTFECVAQSLNVAFFKDYQTALTHVRGKLTER